MKTDGIKTTASNWVFDENVAPKFDKHVASSVPDYEKTQDLACEFAMWFARDNGTVLDLGASTGTTILKMREQNPTKSIEYIGYDNSKAMIEQAKKKGVSIRFQDLATLNPPEFDYAVSLYTIQFLSLTARKQLLLSLREKMLDGGAVLVVEKVLASTAQFQDIQMQMYWEMKIRRGHDTNDVFNKARSLRSVMTPLSVEENEKLFAECSFKNVELVYRFGSFAGWLLL